jgi:filamentous hemagglutinin family protein
MNHVYRLVWSNRRNGWVAVAETARGRKKGGARKLVLAALSLASAAAQAGPTGGQVVSGNGQITTSGTTTTITQSSQNLSLNWQSFNIAPQETVGFRQPSASAVAVNHIFDTNGTQILGHLNANGQVYLINPNGILFGQGSVVNVGGLVASTLNPNDPTPGGTTRSFSGTGAGSVTNEGTITATPGGYVVLMGNRVSNTGTIVAQMGSVGLGAGSAVTLTFANDNLVSVQVDRSTLNNFAANGGLIQADGGRVVMTAGARDALLASAVNNTGVTEAHTVEDHEGTITLLAGMSAGQVNVGGTLDASAPNGGNGGAIETSAAHVAVANNARVTTAAAKGLVGSWLVDPQDFTVAASGGDVTGSTLSAELANTDIALQSSSGGTGGPGNVNVNDQVTWSANTTLTLTASNNVNVNANVTATGATAGLVINPNTANGLEPASGTGVFSLNNGSSITLSGVHPALSIAGQTYTVIHSLGMQGSTTGTDLQGMNRDPSGHYALGADIDASSTASWNSGAGFTPIGSYGSPFTGTLDGLGHSIGHLTINLPGGYDTGLFPYVGPTGVVQNVGLVGGSVTGGTTTGSLVGKNYGTINNSYATSPVTGSFNVGGLVGLNYGAIKNSYATGAVHNSSYTTGGLVGGNGTYGNHSGANISNSYATGAVTGGATDVGGLVGSDYGSIANSYATGAAISTGHYGWFIGGLVGALSGPVSNSYSTGLVNGAGHLGGLVGMTFSFGAAQASVTNSFWNVTTSGQSSSGGGTGLITAQMQAASNFSGFNFTTTPGATGNNWVMVDADGTLNNAGGATGATYPMLASEYATTITNAHQLQLMAMAPSANYSLGADINAAATATSGDVWIGTTGFVPVGTASAGFSGTFNALGHTINGLTINNGSLNDVGLFGTVGTSGTIENVGLVDANITGGEFVGALVGANYGGTISNSYSTGTVSGSDIVGGLVGVSGIAGIPANPGFPPFIPPTPGVPATYGTITNSHSTASVQGNGNIGGLVGRVDGTVAGSYATGSVTSSNYALGGLVGDFHSGSISDSYATGAVTGTGPNGRRAGGLVGIHYGGDITDSFATGAVSGNHAVGGLIGVNFGGTTSDVYATGAASVTDGQAGGLIGINEGTVNNGYSTGLVSGTGTGGIGNNLGGLIGGSSYSGVSVTNSYWNSETSGQSTSAFGSPLTTAQMVHQSNYSGWDFTGTWAIYEGNTNPLLRAFMTPLTITAGNATKTYDGTAYSGGNGVSYSVTPDGRNLLGSLTYGGISQGVVNAGSYAIAVQGLYSNQFGYLITYADGSLTVNRATLTVTGTNVANKVYDGTTAATLTGGTLSGVIGSDAVTLTQTGAFVSPNAGTGVAVTASDNLGGTAAGNYTITQPAGLSANITPATLAVTGTNVANKVYDGTTTASVTGGALSGIISSDAVTLTQAGAFASPNAGTGVAVTASDSLTGAAAGNYTITQPTGLSASIAQVTLTFNATAATGVAGTTPSGLSGAVNGFVTGDTLANSTSGTLSWTTSATGSSPAGSYAIDGGGLTAVNYLFTQAAGNATALTLTAAPPPVTPPPVMPPAVAPPPAVYTTPPAIAGLESITLPAPVSSPTLVLVTAQTGPPATTNTPAASGDGPAAGGSIAVSSGNSVTGAPTNSSADASSNSTVIDTTLDLNGKGKLVIENSGVRLPATSASIH